MVLDRARQRRAAQSSASHLRPADAVGVSAWRRRLRKSNETVELYTHLSGRLQKQSGLVHYRPFELVVRSLAVASSRLYVQDKAVASELRPPTALQAGPAASWTLLEFSATDYGRAQTDLTDLSPRRTGGVGLHCRR